MTEHTIGVDISKSHLDVFDAERREAKRFENSASGFRAFEKWCGKLEIARVVYEPTGPYHRNFEERFCDKLPLVKVNPLQARRFAEACGTRAKTDALDVRGLARMGVALELEPDIPVAKTTRILKDVQVARAALVKERTVPPAAPHRRLLDDAGPAQRRAPQIPLAHRNLRDHPHDLPEGRRSYRDAQDPHSCLLPDRHAEHAGHRVHAHCHLRPRSLTRAATRAAARTRDQQPFNP